MNLRRFGAERSLPISLLLFGLLVPACSTETVPTDPLEPAASPGRILGLVTWDGEPVPGVTVTLGRSGSDVATVMTTGNGEFGFSGLDAGLYTVAIPEIAGMRCSRVVATMVVPGQAAVLSFACVTTPPPAAVGTVEGRVTVNGVAARGVLVSISDVSRRIAWRTTTDDGFYRFPDVPTGPKTVWISTEEPCSGTQQENTPGRGLRRQLEVTVSHDGVAIADFACSGQVLTGHVTLNGISVSGWRVAVCYGPLVWEDGCVPRQATNSEGLYVYTSLRWDGLGAGEYFMFVEPPSGVVCPEQVGVPVPSGVTVTMDFACRAVPSGDGAGYWDY